MHWLCVTNMETLRTNWLAHDTYSVSQVTTLPSVINEAWLLLMANVVRENYYVLQKYISFLLHKGRPHGGWDSLYCERERV